jgi:hypothetical protein
MGMKRKETPQRPDDLLEMLQQVKANYIEEEEKRKRGRPRIYAGLSILLLAVVAVVMKTFKSSELHRLVSQDEKLRKEIELEAVPDRTTVSRRLKKLLPEAEAQVNGLGQQIVTEVEVKPEKGQPKISAVDGRMYQAQGPRWHKQDREAGRVPPELRNVDTESSWLKSGYRGWVQGYHLVLQGLVFPYPVPIFAAWRANTEGESTIVAKALASGSLPITDVLLGDESFGGAELVATYAEAGGWLLTSKELPKLRKSWKNDLFAYRKQTIELLFQRVIQASDLKSCPVKGLGLNGAFVIASVWIYQIIFLSNYREGKALGQIKEAIEQARWRLAG